MDHGGTLESLEQERDFYLALLDLHHAEDASAFLERALALIVRVSGARHGYLSLGGGGQVDSPRVSSTLQLSPEGVDAVQRLISTGIIAEALSTGRMIQTSSALEDPRFGEQESVRKNAIQAVLCAPIGIPPNQGVLYLQGAQRGRFDARVEHWVELFVRQVSPIAGRICQSLFPLPDDPTLPYRARLPHAELRGRSQAMARLLEQVSCVAPLDVDVLLTGPTGTGKTAVARTIWQHSARADRAFVEVNCATIPELLFEAEMFGVRRGSHSTAHEDREGKIGAAQGGTLFLDEIAEISLTAQAKLLQFLQSRNYSRLGSPDVEHANVRIVAATNRDLIQLVREGGFREDLLYRLQVLPIELPALSARLDDVSILAHHFCERYSERYGLIGLRLSPGALGALSATSWPGNVRQLENVVHGGVVRAHSERSPVVEARHCFPEAEPSDAPATLQTATKEFQRRLVEQRLIEHEWNIKATSQSLDIARSHLYNLIAGFSLKRSD